MRATQRIFYYTPSEQDNTPMRCDQKELATLLQNQWKLLSEAEIAETHYIKHDIALLIEQKYGVHPLLTEHYLSHIEDKLPVPA